MVPLGKVGNVFLSCSCGKLVKKESLKYQIILTCVRVSNCDGVDEFVQEEYHLIPVTDKCTKLTSLCRKFCNEVARKHNIKTLNMKKKPFAVFLR